MEDEYCTSGENRGKRFGVMSTSAYILLFQRRKLWSKQLGVRYIIFVYRKSVGPISNAMKYNSDCGDNIFSAGGNFDLLRPRSVFRENLEHNWRHAKSSSDCLQQIDDGQSIDCVAYVVLTRADCSPCSISIAVSIEVSIELHFDGHNDGYAVATSSSYSR